MTYQPTGRDLQCFAVLAAVKNVSRAAERLDLAQSSLSMLVKRLEDYFGTPLIIRKKAGIDLTRAGLRLVESGKTLQEQWRNLKAAVLADVEEVSGIFSLGCHPTAAAYALPQVIAAILAKHSRIELRFAHDLSRRLTEDVVSQRLDLAIVSNPFEHPDLVVKPLYLDKLLAFQAHAGVAVNRDVLLCDPEMSETATLMESKAFKAFKFKRMIISPHLEYLHELTAAGAGIGFFPAEVLFTLNKGKSPLDRVQPVPNSGIAFDCRISLIYRQENARTAAARTLIRALETGVKGLDPLVFLKS